MWYVPRPGPCSKLLMAFSCRFISFNFFPTCQFLLNGPIVTIFRTLWSFSSLCPKLACWPLAIPLIHPLLIPSPWEPSHHYWSIQCPQSPQAPSTQLGALISAHIQHSVPPMAPIYRTQSYSSHSFTSHSHHLIRLFPSTALWHLFKYNLVALHSPISCTLTVQPPIYRIQWLSTHSQHLITIRPSPALCDPPSTCLTTTLALLLPTYNTCVPNITHL